MQPTIKQSGNDYAVITPFNKAFVNELKASIPIGARSFDPEAKAWIVTPEFIEMAAQIVEEFFGVKPTIPELVKVEASQKYSFQLDYVGIPKFRQIPNEAEKTALGLSKGAWRVVFTEAVLKAWFEEKDRGGSFETLFSLLLCNESSTEQEIKSGYRRLARQWHPDVCKEDNAAEMFKRINEAYTILSDPLKRKRYQAGLAFEQEASSQSNYRKQEPDFYTPPLRCGNLTVTGQVTVGKLHVTEILTWDDVINQQGQVMVSSWDKETQAVRIEWV